MSTTPEFPGLAPSLEHYYGRAIDSISPEGDGWKIVLVGGVEIICTDPNAEMPPEVIVGQVFTMAAYSTGATRLYFGPEDNPTATEMQLDPTKYAISDPERASGQVHYPQQVQETPADAILAERREAAEEAFADRPDKKAEASQKDADPGPTPKGKK